MQQEGNVSQRMYAGKDMWPKMFKEIKGGQKYIIDDYPRWTLSEQDVS